MKRRISNYFWVGLMTIIITTATIWLLAKMAGRQADADNYHSYYINVTGLGFGTPVYFEGYRIGQVDAVTPENRNQRIIFKVDFSIEQNWKVPSDSFAQIQSAGLLGDISINISAGESNTHFKKGDEIPGKPPADLLGQLSKISSDVDALTDEKIKPLLELIYERTDQITGELNTQIPTLFETLNNSATEVNLLIKDSRNLLNTDNQNKFSQILTNVQDVTLQLKQTVASAETSIQSSQALIEDMRALLNQEDSQLATILNTASNSMWNLAERLETITSEIESASMNINEATNQIRKKPSSLLFSKDSGNQDDEL